MVATSYATLVLNNSFIQITTLMFNAFRVDYCRSCFLSTHEYVPIKNNHVYLSMYKAGINRTYILSLSYEIALPNVCIPFIVVTATYSTSIPTNLISTGASRYS